MELTHDPSLIPTAVEELLRLVTPVFAWKRKAKEAARIGDVEVPEGANVLLLLGSANHDDAVFADPERDRPAARERAQPPRVRPRHPLLPRRVAGAAGGAGRARGADRAAAGARARARPGVRLLRRTRRSARRPRCTCAGRCRSCALEACTDVSRVGGKALSLGTMLRAGFPVPDGFAVTTSAFAAGRVPEAEIRAAYAALGDDVPVAVRSSATSEDARRRLVRGPVRHVPVGDRRRRGAPPRRALLGLDEHRPRARLPARPAASTSR